MNYGYAGTRELNEALTSRFVVIQMPSIDQDGLVRLLGDEFPTLEKSTKSSLRSYSSICRKSAKTQKFPKRRSTCAVFSTRCV